jgi:integrase
MWKTKTPAGWRYFPAQFHMNHGDYEVKPGAVVENGVEVTYPQGKFFLRSYVHGKKVYQPVDSCHPRDAAQALRAAVEAQRIQVSETETTTEHARAQRHIATRKNGIPSLLKDAAAAYILHCEKLGRVESADDARQVIEEFRKATGVVYTSKITRADVLHFCSWLKSERGNGDRTVHNKYGRLLAFLRFAKVTVEGLEKGDRPTYEEKAVNTYDAGQMEQLRNAADDYMRLAIDCAQQLGLRYQELIHAEWADLNQCMFTVRGKVRAGYTFKVKDKEQRNVPVNADLCARLTAWKESHPGTMLILGTASDKPNTHLLRQLKRLAKNNGLNCGHCKGCLGREKECAEWTLHRFRRTYVTTLLRAGVDLKTTQRMAGHSDLKSTQRYLDAMSAENVLPVVNAINW